ncbi:MAG: hypothetical protein LBM25_01545 [Bacteroidales bacterium]|nr:hypothetical protein [Bacteroidales bacterium]
MYIFGGTISAEEISKIINLKYTNNNWDDDSWKMVLVKNRKIMYENEYHPQNISFYQYPGYTYHDGAIIGYYLYTDSIFTVKKSKEYLDRSFYILYGVEDALRRFIF